MTSQLYMHWTLIAIFFRSYPKEKRKAEGQSSDCDLHDIEKIKHKFYKFDPLRLEMQINCLGELEGEWEDLFQGLASYHP